MAEYVVAALNRPEVGGIHYGRPPLDAEQRLDQHSAEFIAPIHVYIPHLRVKSSLSVYLDTCVCR